MDLAKKGQLGERTRRDYRNENYSTGIKNIEKGGFRKHEERAQPKRRAAKT